MLGFFPQRSRVTRTSHKSQKILVLERRRAKKQNQQDWEREEKGKLKKDLGSRANTFTIPNRVTFSFRGSSMTIRCSCQKKKTEMPDASPQPQNEGTVQ